MHAKDGMEPLLAQEGEMDKGAACAISYEHLSRAHRLMERRHLGHIMRVPVVYPTAAENSIVPKTR